MAETARRSTTEDEEVMDTPDVHGVGMKLQRAEEAHRVYAGVEEKPSQFEVLTWFFYDLCSYFIHTVLIPIVFPLIISQIKVMSIPQEPFQGLGMGYKGLNCRPNEMKLYEGLTYRSIKVNNWTFSPLEWTSISWVIGLVIAAPILGTLSTHLDYGHNQQLITAASIAVGGLFCLPAGFFKTTWIFPPYIAAIVVASTIAAASHSRHLGLMVRGFVGSPIQKCQFSDRRAIASWLSLYATASGCLGSATISAFTYHMLRHSNKFVSLWIVSIFSGLKWFAGIIHVGAAKRPGIANTTPIAKTHVISIFNYPHAAGTLAGVFLSSFSTMCIFTSGVLHLVGQLCFKPINILLLWLTYFVFPLLSLPLLQPFQQLIKADAVKMQLLGLILSILTSGFGFYYRFKNWNGGHVLLFATVQSTAAGLLHAFGRVLLLDCAPSGKEGAFAVWFSWVRALGTSLGFAVASTGLGNINRSFGVAFCVSVFGTVVLIFGNISNFEGAKAAGHVREDYSEKGSPVHGLDEGGIEVKGRENVETPSEGRVEV